MCETCHKASHKGEIQLNFKRGKSYRNAAFMGIMRKTLLNRLRELYPNVYETYGYITKNTRIENDLPKEHYIDARCISGNPKASPLDYYIYQIKANQSKLDFLIKNAKKMGIVFSRCNDISLRRYGINEMVV